MASNLLLLQMMVEATVRGRLTWQVVGQDIYEAETNGVFYRIKIEQPIGVDGKPTNANLYSVLISEMLITFADGTESSMLVNELLSTAFAEWKDEGELERSKRDSAHEELRLLLNDDHYTTREK